MLLNIDATRYRRMKREDVITLLEAADLQPDQFISHRNHTFTAKFLKTKLPDLANQRYETQLEAKSEHNLAIFKRPTQLDRGKYVTFSFGFVATERLGIDFSHLGNGNGNGNSLRKANESESDLVIATEMMGIVRDMKQLTRYAHDVVETDENKKPALVALTELEKQVNRMADRIHRMILANHKVM